MASFICLANSNICSGGREATTEEMASGAFSGSISGPKGEGSTNPGGGGPPPGIGGPPGPAGPIP